jgi:hypothetical protein
MWWWVGSPLDSRVYPTHRGFAICPTPGAHPPEGGRGPGRLPDFGTSFLKFINIRPKIKICFPVRARKPPKSPCTCEMSIKIRLNLSLRPRRPQIPHYHYYRPSHDLSYYETINPRDCRGRGGGFLICPTPPTQPLCRAPLGGG